MPELTISIPDDYCQGDAAAVVLAEVNDCLSLLTAVDCTVTASWATPDPEPTIDPNWVKLPKAGSQRQDVLLAIMERSQTRDELCTTLGLSTSSISPRVLELICGDWIVEGDEQRETSWGGKGVVLHATQKARSYVRLAPLAWFPGNVRPECAR